MHALTWSKNSESFKAYAFMHLELLPRDFSTHNTRVFHNRLPAVIAKCSLPKLYNK